MKRILLVDDHSVVRKGLRQILEDEFEDLEIGEAGDAQEALEQVWRQTWDFVCLDISLPNRSGLDVLKEIKEARPGLPVLVLSMHPEDQYAVRALKAGAAGYITKDRAAEELAEAIRRIISGGRYITTTLAEELAARLGNGQEGPLHEQLSDREYQVMCLIASGKTASAIAEQLSLSVKTISTYRTRVLQKMRMENNAELTSYAIKRGLVMD